LSTPAAAVQLIQDVMLLYTFQDCSREICKLNLSLHVSLTTTTVFWNAFGVFTDQNEEGLYDTTTTSPVSLLKKDTQQ